MSGSCLHSLKFLVISEEQVYDADSKTRSQLQEMQEAQVSIFDV